MAIAIGSGRAVAQSHLSNIHTHIYGKHLTPQSDPRPNASCLQPIHVVAKRIGKQFPKGLFDSQKGILGGGGGSNYCRNSGKSGWTPCDMECTQPRHPPCHWEWLEFNGHRRHWRGRRIPIGCVFHQGGGERKIEFCRDVMCETCLAPPSHAVSV